jgi:hypothetical protein
MSGKKPSPVSGSDARTVRTALHGRRASVKIGRIVVGSKAEILASHELLQS